MLYSTLTDDAQTTLPSDVTEALGVRPGDRLEYEIHGDHAVIRRVEEDPALEPFLALLERDIEQHPERLQRATVGWVERMRQIAGGTDVDVDEPIEGPVEL